MLHRISKHALMTTSHFTTPTERQIALWLLRILSPNLLRDKFVRGDIYLDSDAADYLGLPDDPQGRAGEIHAGMEDMRKRLERMKAVAFSPPVRRNFRMCAELFELSPTDTRILEFLAAYEMEEVLKSASQATLKRRGNTSVRFLSAVLCLPAQSVAAALRRGGNLTKSGLLTNNNRGRHRIDPWRHQYARGNSPLPELQSTGVASLLFENQMTTNDLIALFGVRAAGKPELGLADFPHLRRKLDLLVSYLDEAVRARRAGANVLFYGPPGTGKTQLARTLAKTLRLQLMEISTEDSDDEPLDAGQRIAGLAMAQNCLRHGSVAFTFDEAEDVFSAAMLERSFAQQHKGWFNNQLESNPKPVFWISNSASCLDPAFVRRFDMVVEVPVPPRSVREKLVARRVSGVISRPLVNRLAEIENLSPAVIERVGKVVSSSSAKLTPPERDKAFEGMVRDLLRAQGHHNVTSPRDKVLPDGVLDVSFFNTEADLLLIATMLRQNPSARLCAYGLPGTGKTAFGHWLAREIDRPLQIERASDLLSPYLGKTEINMARAFERATENESVLLIDEVDSFLQDRSAATRSWEVTQVNEMLTQIERFDGVLIVSTNSLDQLDAAALRRFDIKLHFSCLTGGQVRSLLQRWCEKLAIPAPDEPVFQMAESLTTVTPGDFSAIARRHGFQPFRNASEFLRALAGECDLKAGTSRRIGFH